MDYNKKIDQIRELQGKSYKGKKSPAIVILNFYTLLTIVIISIAILLYSNYIIPAYEAKKQREIKEKQAHQEKRKK